MVRRIKPTTGGARGNLVADIRREAGALVQHVRTADSIHKQTTVAAQSYFRQYLLHRYNISQFPFFLHSRNHMLNYTTGL
jgi:hypothetical protein